MKTIRLALASLLFVVFFASVAMAQVQRTFVSGLGSNSNPCSRTAPCRTFDQAISQTTAAGEIYVLDTAGYGAFTINKSVSIIAPPGVTAGITVFSGDGIDVNIGDQDVVVLRGLTIDSLGGGNSGVVFNPSGATAILRVEGCAIRNFHPLQGVAAGIFLSGPGNLLVKDTEIADCVAGIALLTGSGVAKAAIDHVTVDNCIDGVDLQATGSGRSLAAIRDSTVSGSLNAGMETLADGAGGPASAFLDVERCLIANGVTGLFTLQFNGGNSAMSISNSLVSHNSLAGFSISSGTTIFTRGNNSFFGNGMSSGTLSPVNAL